MCVTIICEDCKRTKHHIRCYYKCLPSHWSMLYISCNQCESKTCYGKFVYPIEWKRDPAKKGRGLVGEIAESVEYKKKMDIFLDYARFADNIEFHVKKN
ncbi:hypothetical protein AVEN_8032-1 [Araneus ventricosus]|uniref:Uncharacterized protein n=1 Tax=Araneus ventricosus TaxID=182803 RepID=A0A4Y2I0T4_ARAVE|nr:hypothetical protein AVEN_8032-1 [Araneus ventricosus]